MQSGHEIPPVGVSSLDANKNIKALDVDIPTYRV
jgi:hypothetical protein